jgi:hypothetical protein
MIGNAAHRTVSSMSQRQVQQPGDLNRIIIEHLIEISKSEKQNIMRIFIFL